MEAVRGGRGSPRVGVDWLSVTTGPEASAGLEGWTIFGEEGRPQRGFLGSEERVCLGGRCWRKMGPRQPSKRWGREYESWEWSGSATAWAASRWLRGREDVKPTRVDVAFDFEVPDGLRAEVVAAAIAPHLAARGITPGIVGEGDDFTCYAGAKSSEIRVRIYRKDLKDSAWLIDLGHTLRVEVVMKGETAEAWWQTWQRSEQQAYAVAADHVLRLTGLQMQAEIAEAEALGNTTSASDFAQLCFEFVAQYASHLEAADRVGVDLPALSREWMQGWARDTWRRHGRRLQLCEGLDAGDVERRVLAMMSARRSEQATA